MYTLRCSFCGCDERKAGRIIQGPGVTICRHCVTECVHLLVTIKSVKHPYKRRRPRWWRAAPRWRERGLPAEL